MLSIILSKFLEFCALSFGTVRGWLGPLWTKLISNTVKPGLDFGGRVQKIDFLYTFWTFQKILEKKFEKKYKHTKV